MADEIYTSLIDSFAYKDLLTYQDMNELASNDETLRVLLTNYIDGCWVYRVDGDNIGITVGEIQVNGQMRRLTTAITNLTYSAPDAGDWLDIFAIADGATGITGEVQDSGITPGGSTASGSNARMIASVFYDDGTAKINKIINYRKNKIIGWDYIQGNNNQVLGFSAVAYGKTFDFIPSPKIFYAGSALTSGGKPTSLNSFASYAQCLFVGPYSATTTGVSVQGITETGVTFANTYYHGIYWEVEGRFA